MLQTELADDEASLTGQKHARDGVHSTTIFFYTPATEIKLVTNSAVADAGGDAAEPQAQVLKTENVVDNEMAAAATTTTAPEEQAL